MAGRFTNRAIRSIPRDERGLSVTEFALIAPVFLSMLLGTMDMGHTLYMQSQVQGVVQKAARDLSLETGTVAANQAALDAKVTANIKMLAANATVTITRDSYQDFTKAATATMEPFTDTNSDGTCDAGEPYQDNNNNNNWDVSGGNAGQGGAKDVVVYKVDVSYPRMFSFKYLGLPATTKLQALTVLANQPYGEQADSGAPTQRNCI